MSSNPIHSSSGGESSSHTMVPVLRREVCFGIYRRPGGVSQSTDGLPGAWCFSSASAANNRERSSDRPVETCRLWRVRAGQG